AAASPSAGGRHIHVRSADSSYPILPGLQNSLRQNQVYRSGDLQVFLVPLHQIDPLAQPLHGGAVIRYGDAPLNSRLKRGFQQRALEDLGCLHSPQGRPVQRLRHRAVVPDGFDGVLHRHRRGRRPAAGGLLRHIVDELRRHQGAGAVLHRQQLHALPGLQCCQKHRVGPALPTPDHLGAFGDAVGPAQLGDLQKVLLPGGYHDLVDPPGHLQGRQCPGQYRNAV
ncbi:Nitrogen regulatory protein P-II, partial [Dysosmobacter welbionis]